MPQLLNKNATISKKKCQFTFDKMPPLPEADPGFVVRGGVSRRGVWGPLKVPSWSRVEPW